MKNLNTFEKSISLIAAIIFIAFWLVFVYWLNGYAIVNLWAWFIMPIFPVIKINTVEAIGLYLFCSYLFKNRSPTDSAKNKKKIFENLSLPIIYPLMALIVGSIIKSYL